MSKKPVTLDCPECEWCCAIGLCCAPNSPEQLEAMTSLIVKDGKWTDPDLARSIAEAVQKAYFRGVKSKHGPLKAAVAALTTPEPPPA